MDLQGKTITLGITGGIAAYKACEVVRLLQKEGATVQVVMTEAATHFVGTATLQALSGQWVWTDQWDQRTQNGMSHISLTRNSDLVLIAPASADFIFKLAHGAGNDLLSTLCLANTCPLLIAPAMNREMWANPATQRNLAIVQDDGIEVIGPGSGDTACGEVGDGRMSEPEEIVHAVIRMLQPKHLAGKKVLLTAGPTFEAIDPIRGITNHSSGKMGFALARACRDAGAEVALIAGPCALTTPYGVERTNVTSAVQMHAAVMERVKEVDVFIAVAAVADWRPTQAAPQKIKKWGDSTKMGPSISLIENPDILAEVAKLPKAPWCVGFAAETDDLERNGQIKRQRKGIPLLVANLGQETFGKDDNQLLLIDEQGVEKLDRASKLVLARTLIAGIAKRMQRR